MLEAIKNNWREYLMKAWSLGAFMVSACAFGGLFFHRDPPFAAINFTLPNVRMGIAMGATVVPALTIMANALRIGAQLLDEMNCTFL
jgi:hypothetical protein